MKLTGILLASTILVSATPVLAETVAQPTQAAAARPWAGGRRHDAG